MEQQQRVFSHASDAPHDNATYDANDTDAPNDTHEADDFDDSNGWMVGKFVRRSVRVDGPVLFFL